VSSRRVLPLPSRLSTTDGTAPVYSFEGESTLYDEDVENVADKLGNLEANHNNPIDIFIAYVLFPELSFRRPSVIILACVSNLYPKRT